MSIYKFGANKPRIHPSVFVAPTAAVIGNVTLDENSSIWFNCVLRGDGDRIHIRENTNIQDLTMVHVDPEQPALIGKNVTVGHGCVIHGCTVEDDCLIGMGARLLNGCVIGRGSIVAAGTIVLEKTLIPPNSFVTGVPGKVKKATSDEIQQGIALSAEVYVEKSKTYKDKQNFSLLA